LEFAKENNNPSQTEHLSLRERL
jgi:hypothetical protein